eukprot:6591888-Prymnesium_polylepis.2
MARDVACLNAERLQQLQAAGGFGRLGLSQLYVGTPATSGARSLLHFDNNENIFVQLAGSKRFRLFVPTEAGNLYAYPQSHAMDRKAQVGRRRSTRPDCARAHCGPVCMHQVVLSRAADPRHMAAFPRLQSARSCEVTLRAGEVLFLPAFWWHEVVTEPVPPGELCVSVNFCAFRAQRSPSADPTVDNAHP